MQGDCEEINDMNHTNGKRLRRASGSGSGDLFKLETLGAVGGSSTVGQRVPKPRNVFTLSSNVFPLSQENVAKVEEESARFDQPEFQQQGNVNVDTDMTTRGAEDLGGSSDEAESVSSSSTCKRKSHHGSLENLFKPKNHRLASRLQDIKAKRLNNNRGDGEKETVERLAEENLALLADVEKSRRKGLALKACAALSFTAFRAEVKKVKEVNKLKDRKTEEAAARMILHTLLLNSWRNCKTELVTLIEDNAQLTKTTENLSLQLKVVRHIQSLDKEKMTQKTAEVDKIKNEMKRLKEENDKKRESMDKIEEDLNSLQANVQNLQDLNKLHVDEAVELKETIKILEESLHLEKTKSGNLERASVSLKHDKKRADDQLGDFAKQNHQWQERARSFESENWALKMDLEGKDAQIKDIRKICEALRKEKSDLVQLKMSMNERLAELSYKLEEADIDRKDMNKELEMSNDKLNEQIQSMEEIKKSLNKSRKEFSRIEKELLSFKVKNVKRRREWANMLYFIFNPIDAFRRSLVQEQNNNGGQSQSRRTIQ